MYRTLLLTVYSAAFLNFHAVCDTTSSKHRPCQARAVNFEGWSAQEISNEWVTLTLVPQLGGRLMQVRFGPHSYLFVNPKYRGKYIPPTEANGNWFNYGGDKLWPLPEGTQDDQHWPGPVADVLDDGMYTFQILSTAPSCRVRLDGPGDARTGLQYSREITLGSDSPEIWFRAMMKNVSDHPIRWSMQSVTQYDTAASPGSGEYNAKFWAFTPVNPTSAYVDGYHFRLGLSGDPSVEVRNHMFRLHWSYFEREIWIDSTAGWLAVLDGSSQFAMIERFPHSAGAEYPGKASVIFYTNGQAVEFDKQGAPHLTPANPLEVPFYMEAEVNSPMIRLNVGDTYALDTNWFPARIADEITAVTQAGAVGRALTATWTDNGLLLAGSFGVFAPGDLIAFLLDAEGVQMATVTLQTVSPLDRVELAQTIKAPATVSRISVHLRDERGRDLGPLADATIAKGS
ncbi:MAG TPA: hypothetical protein VFA89_16830 [Terriglobales bacterium]|nr:hypothetical protein [Terriglobales bacterium]